MTHTHKKKTLDKDQSLRIIKRILSENMRAYAPRYVWAFFLMLIIAASTSLSAWIMKDVVDEVFFNRDFNRILLVSAFVVALFVAKGIATYGQLVTLSRIGNDIVARNQRRVYEHLLRQGVSFYQGCSSDELVTRISHNARSVRDVLNQLVVGFGRDLLTLFGLVSVMIIQDPVMSILALIIAPPAIWGGTRLVKRVRVFAKKEFYSLTRIVSVMQETALGIRIIKSFQLEGMMRARMDEAVIDTQKQADKIAILGARTSPLMETLGGVAIGAAILYSGWRTALGGQSPGEFISFLTAMLLAYDPAKRLSRLQVNIEAGLVGARIMFELLDRPLTITEKPDAKELALQKGEVVFESVDFRYQDQASVLHGLHLTAKGGCRTALVGPSGGGKSTILALVKRLYDPDCGRVLIDGQDVRDLSFASLNAAISFVSQETFLFSGTIKDNILIGKPQADDAEIIKAAKAAHVHEFVGAMPQRYDTHVGENGSALSGGQRQRVAIARAILKDAPIVLLDEATSALDSEAEAAVQDAFERLMGNKTTIVIAHRFSTIRTADKICVIEKGQLVEEGTHDALLETKGLYARLLSLQFGKGAQAEQTATGP